MKYRLVPSPRVRAMANRMTFRQALAQVCCPLLNFEASETYGGAHLGGGPRDVVAERIERLKAASDVPPLCTADRRFHEEMESLVEKGLLKGETVYARAARMLALKEDLGLFDERRPPPTFDASSHSALAGRVVDGSETLVRDRTGVLPRALTPSTRVLHLVVANDYEDRKAAYDGLSRALAQRCSLETWVDPGPAASVRAPA